MADVERVRTGLRYCSETPEWNCDKQCPYGENGKKEAGACWVELNRDALSAIDGLQAELAELKERRWIPVSERLPKDGSDILAYYDNKIETRIIPCNYYKGEWYDCIFDTERVFKYITHWMPLPEPPIVD